MNAGDQGVCAECGRGFTRKAARGRPQRYCGSVCRRAAEYALNRAQGLLRRAQQRRQDAGLKLALSDGWTKSDDEKRLAFWTSEVERQSAELRRLLEASESPAEFPRTA